METQNKNQEKQGSYSIVCRRYESYGDYNQYTKGPIEEVELKGLAKKIAETMCAELNKNFGGSIKATKNFFVHGKLEGTIERHYRVEYDPNTPKQKIQHKKAKEAYERLSIFDKDFDWENIGPWKEPVKTFGCYWDPKTWP